jgi:Tol biopolymer transport system component
VWYERQVPWFVVARDANLPGQGSAGAPAGPADTLSSSLFDCRAPSFSGDGTHVAFASTRSGPWRVFAMAAAGEASSGPAKQLTQGPGAETAPRWSRASGQIVYVRGGDTLALTDPTGAVLGDLARGRTPGWSPDGRALAFADSAGTLWTLEGVGRARRALTAPPVRALDPWWGTGALADAIVFAGPAQGGGSPLWRVPALGGAPVPLTTDTVAGASDTEPAVSPDGRWVCFTRQRRGDRDLWLLDTTAGDARPLVTNFRGQDGHAEWSPDGRRIVYESGGAVNLYRADVRPLLLR